MTLTLDTVSETLPDGSVATVEQRDHNFSLISRYVDGECVWGQGFGCGPREDHAAQVADVLRVMREIPANFREVVPVTVTLPPTLAEHGPECPLSGPPRPGLHNGNQGGKYGDCACVLCHCGPDHQPGGVHGSCRRCHRKRYEDLRVAR